MRNLILKYVLQNAIRYNGKASASAIIGKLFQENPDLKADKTIFAQINNIVNEVNKLTLEQQKQQLEKLAPELLEKKKEEKKQLPELKNVKGKFTVRFAPNPNGPLSLGHARPALLNWLYAKKYHGIFINRFDDTDGKIKPPLKQAYSWILNDLKWLGIKPSKIIKASSRFNIYYRYAEKLIKIDKAYVCTCEQEEKSNLLLKKQSCPCRFLSVEQHLKRWKEMFSKNGYKEGQAVLRIKTDLNAKNPAVRDWVAFKILDKSKHPLKKAKVWPLLNFASAIDDHEFKVTHIIRGIDLLVSDERQKYIYTYFNWSYPYTYYNGKLIIEGMKSTTQISDAIKNKELTGWDDPRIATLISLRKRGYQPEAIRNFIFDLGLNRNDINVDMDNLNAYNKAIVDKTASRYFFIDNPHLIKIKNAPNLTAKLPLHPDNNKGFRQFTTTDEFYIQDKIENNLIYRFIGLFNFQKFKFISKEHQTNLNAKLIHWLPKKGNLNATIIMPDNSRKKGLIENNAKNIKVNEVVQFVRFGFVRLDKKTKNHLTFYYCHD